MLVFGQRLLHLSTAFCKSLSFCGEVDEVDIF